MAKQAAPQKLVFNIPIPIAVIIRGSLCIAKINKFPNGTDPKGWLLWTLGGVRKLKPAYLLKVFKIAL
jgi:hypothetical protein